MLNVESVVGIAVVKTILENVLVVPISSLSAEPLHLKTGVREILESRSAGETNEGADVEVATASEPASHPFKTN